MRSNREIIVSALGARPPLDNPPPAGEHAVLRMIDFWRNQLAAVLPNHPDLIVLPEECDRYPEYTPEAYFEYLKYRGERIRDFFAEIACDHHCNFALCTRRAAGDGTWRTTTELIGRHGETVGAYNKNFHVPDETFPEPLLAGVNAPVIETEFGRVAMAICFDLNFMELLEHYREARPNLIVFCSMYHGGLMQRFWAYRAGAYFIGAVCGNECTIINPLGELVAHSTSYFSHVTTTINLDYQLLHLDGNWEKLAAARQRYGREIEISDPGQLGCVMLTSHHPERSSKEITAEFGMENWREYYLRAQRYRFTPGEMEKTSTLPAHHRV